MADLTEEVLNSLLEEKAPRPELHSPDQVDGDVAEVPFFPNPAVKAVEASQSREVLSKQEESVEKPLSTRSQDRLTWLGDKIAAEDNSEDNRQVGKNHAFGNVVMFHVKHRPTYMFHEHVGHAR